MIIPFVIGTYGTSNVSKYSVKEKQKFKNMILNKKMIYILNIDQQLNFAHLEKKTIIITFKS
jgi:hypothetical protein